jgi:hypothetical protein
LYFTALGEVRKSFIFRRCELPDSNVRGEIARMLLSGGANVNAETGSGETALHAATKNGYLSVIEALLEYNADVNCTTKTDTTPLLIAAQYGHLKCVEVLLKFCANIDSKDNYGMTPLHIAAKYGQLEAVEFFLKFSANVDSKGACGRTALHIASEKGNEKFVTVLLEHGSDINIMSGDGCTPLDFAMAGMARRGARMSHEWCLTRYLALGSPGDALCEIVAENLKRHMVKMKTANLYLCEKNLLSVSYFSNFQKECEKEIVSMKSEMVSDAKVTFYDILTKGESQLAMYAGNESIVQILRSDDYKIRFPIYANMISSNFRKGGRRKELLEQGRTIFHFLFNSCPQLPHVCIGEIFSYLSDEDLRIVIGACKYISNQQP